MILWLLTLLLLVAVPVESVSAAPERIGTIREVLAGLGFPNPHVREPAGAAPALVAAVEPQNFADGTHQTFVVVQWYAAANGQEAAGEAFRALSAKMRCEDPSVPCNRNPALGTYVAAPTLQDYNVRKADLVDMGGIPALVTTSVPHHGVAAVAESDFRCGDLLVRVFQRRSPAPANVRAMVTDSPKWLQWVAAESAGAKTAVLDLGGKLNTRLVSRNACASASAATSFTVDLACRKVASDLWCEAVPDLTGPDADNLEFTWTWDGKPEKSKTKNLNIADPPYGNHTVSVVAKDPKTGATSPPATQRIEVGPERGIVVPSMPSTGQQITDDPLEEKVNRLITGDPSPRPVNPGTAAAAGVALPAGLGAARFLGGAGGSRPGGKR